MFLRNPSVRPHTLNAFVRVKVILYNFFEETTLDSLWKYLVDEDQQKLSDPKYAPLIHEVSDGVYLPYIRSLLPGCQSSNACTSPLLGQSTGSGL
jgi:hypothetical protein